MILRRIHTIKYGMNMPFIISYKTPLRSGLFETMILQHNTITKSEVRDVYSYQGQCLVSMHSDGI